MGHLSRQRGLPVSPFFGATLALAALLAGSVAEGNPQQSARRSAPTHVTELDPATPEALVFDGAVLVGVDVFGRVLAALDEHGDGRGDRFYLFRTTGPYQGPWSRLLERATLIETDGGLAIFTDDRLFGVTLNLETGAAPLPPGIYREAHNYGGGIELSVATPEPGYPGPPLTELSFSDPATWPEAFRPPPAASAGDR
jgi:hypothetical protein